MKWNLWRLRTQWNFLVKRERTAIKIFIPLGLLLLVGSPVLAFFVQTDHPSAFGAFCFLMLLSGFGLLTTAWATFIDHISPRLLTHEELTEGTE